MSTSSENLTGEARRRYETWRGLGLSESAAMDQLHRDGLLADREDGFDRLERAFRGMGMSEATARRAAQGRESTEQAARRQWARPGAQHTPAAENGIAKWRRLIEEQEATRRDIADLAERQKRRIVREISGR